MTVTIDKEQNLATLMKFCRKSSVYENWTEFPVTQNGFVYGTNNSLLVRMPRHSLPDVIPKGGGLAPDIRDVFNDSIFAASDFRAHPGIGVMDAQ